MLTSLSALLLFNDGERDVVEGVVDRMIQRAIGMEGTVTGEHGVGLIKRDHLNHELGESTVDAMRKVSCLRLLDPLLSFRVVETLMTLASLFILRFVS